MSITPYTGERLRIRPDGSTWEIPMVPAAVYSFFNAEGKALYVGCTTRGASRFGDHGEKDWFTESTRVEVEHFEDKSDGLNRERDLIRELRPAHNIAHNPNRTIQRLSPDKLEARRVRREKSRAEREQFARGAAEKRRKWEEERYRVAIECGNCGRGSKSPALWVPKGQSIQDTVCSGCGLKAYRPKKDKAA